MKTNSECLSNSWVILLLTLLQWPADSEAYLFSLITVTVNAIKMKCIEMIFDIWYK